MRAFITLCLVAAAMAQAGVPHLPAYGNPNTVYCYHREDPTDHKCYEACATSDFNTTGITQPGTCNPAVFKVTETTKSVNQCSDGITNVKYCSGGSLHKVSVTFKTKGEGGNTPRFLVEPMVTAVNCVHHNDVVNNKCYEACGNGSFVVPKLELPGACGDEYTETDSTANVNQCSDGVTNVKYCTGGDKKVVALTVKTKGMVGACYFAIQSNKCSEACATAQFKMTGVTTAGTCPSLYKVTEKTQYVLSCSDGVTNTKYCTKPLYIVNVTMKIKGESAPALSLAAPVTTYVHSIVTSPGDHCLEVTIPGGNDSPFWKSEGWKYSAPVRPNWKTGACDRSVWQTVDDTQTDYDGYTSAKNSPYGSVVLNKYGHGTAMMDVVAPMADQVQCGQGSNTEKIMLVNKLRPSMKFRMCTLPVDPKTGWACNHGTNFIDCDRHIKQDEAIELDLGQHIETVLPVTFTSTGAVDMVSECYWKRPAAGWPKASITIDQAWWDALQKTCMAVYVN